MTSIDLTNTYLILGDRSTVDAVDGGASCWQRLTTDADLVAQLDDARLVSAPDAGSSVCTVKCAEDRTRPGCATPAIPHRSPSRSASTR